MIRLFCSLLLALLCVSAHASFSASVDRARLTEGESVELTLESDDPTLFGKPDLSPLDALFEVLGTRQVNRLATQNGQGPGHHPLDRHPPAEAERLRGDPADQPRRQQHPADQAARTGGARPRQEQQAGAGLHRCQRRPGDGLRAGPGDPHPAHLPLGVAIRRQQPDPAGDERREGRTARRGAYLREGDQRHPPRRDRGALRDLPAEERHPGDSCASLQRDPGRPWQRRLQPLRPAPLAGRCG